MALIGQLTLYEEELTIEKSKAYLISWRDEWDEVSKRVIVKLPKAEGLAAHLGVHRDTLYSWAKTHPAFSDILEEMNQKQAESLINNGLSGAYNATIAKLVLGKHGYHDTSEQNLKNDGGKFETIDPELRSKLAALYEDEMKKKIILKTLYEPQRISCRD